MDEQHYFKFVKDYAGGDPTGAYTYESSTCPGNNAGDITGVTVS